MRTPCAIQQHEPPLDQRYIYSSYPVHSKGRQIHSLDLSSEHIPRQVPSYLPGRIQQRMPSSFHTVPDSLHQSPIHCFCGPQSWGLLHPQKTLEQFYHCVALEYSLAFSVQTLPESSLSDPSEPSCIHGHHCCEHPPSPCSAATGRTS